MRIVGALSTLALVAGLAACAPASDKTYLPDTTRRIDAAKMRAAQLRTGSYRDDIPEYTGAPGPDGRHPAYVPDTGVLAYLGSEVETRTPREVSDADAGTKGDLQPLLPGTGAQN